MQWFYANGGEQVGPLNDQEFHERIRAGQITTETPVWREGMPNWLPYGQVSGRKSTTLEPKKKLVLHRDAQVQPDPESQAEKPESDGSSPKAASASASGLTTFTGVLYAAKGWIRFLGILTLISGVLQALSIVGLIFAWIPIWIGLLLCAASSRIAEAHEQGDAFALVTALDKLRLFFKITGILTLISLLAIVIFTVVAFGTLGTQLLPMVESLR